MSNIERPSLQLQFSVLNNCQGGRRGSKKGFIVEQRLANFEPNIPTFDIRHSILNRTDLSTCKPITQHHPLALSI